MTTCNPARDLTDAAEALCLALSRKRGPTSVDYGVSDKDPDFIVFVSSAIPLGAREEVLVEPFGPGYAVRDMGAACRIIAVGITIADAMRRAARTGHLGCEQGCYLAKDQGPMTNGLF